jgi:hypothetical protein
LSIGGIPFAIRLRESPLRRIAGLRYAPFRTSASQGFPIQDSSPGQSRQPVRLRFALNGAELNLREKDAWLSGAMNEYTLDSFLRVALSQLLLAENGLLLHAATVVRNARAYVFMGRSGAGKSTIARHAPAGSALTDEISLLRRHADGWRAHGTPFWGEFRAAGQNTSFPLAGIFALAQAPENRLARLEARAALRAILSCAMFFSAERRDREALLRIAALLAESVAVARLEFRREMDFWPELDTVQ